MSCFGSQWASPFQTCHIPILPLPSPHRCRWCKDAGPVSDTALLHNLSSDPRRNCQFMRSSRERAGGKRWIWRQRQDWWDGDCYLLEQARQEKPKILKKENREVEALWQQLSDLRALFQGVAEADPSPLDWCWAGWKSLSSISSRRWEYQRLPRNSLNPSHLLHV